MTLARLFLVIVILLMAVLAPATAQADGFVIPDDPEAYNRLILDQQILVINIKPNRTADIDLFVAFSDRAGMVNELTYVLPLDSEPRGFSVREESKRRFVEEKIAPLDDFIAERDSWPARFRRGLGLSAAYGDLAFGASLPALAPLALVSVPERSAGLSSRPRLVEAEQTRAEVLGTQTADRIDDSLVEAGLPRDIGRRARLLGTRHTELIRLRTTPVARGEGLNSLGLHFSFNVESETTDRGYRFWYTLDATPLWPGPVALTEVYVSSPERLEHAVTFPRSGDELSSRQIIEGVVAADREDAAGAVREPPLQSENSARFSLEVARGPSQTVSHVVMTMKRDGGDVEVLAQDREPDSFWLLREGLARFLFERSWAGFLALALFVWLSLWRLVGRRLIPLGQGRRWLGLVAEALGILLIYASVSLILLEAGALLVGSAGGASGDAASALYQSQFPLGESLAGVGASAGLAWWLALSAAGWLAGTLVASQALRRWRGATLSGRSLFFRFLAIAALAPIVYNILAFSIIFALWQLV